MISPSIETCYFGSKKRNAYTSEIEENGGPLAQGNRICFSGSEDKKVKKITLLTRAETGHFTHKITLIRSYWISIGRTMQKKMLKWKSNSQMPKPINKSQLMRALKT